MDDFNEVKVDVWPRLHASPRIPWEVHPEMDFDKMLQTDIPVYVECGANDGRTARDFLKNFHNARQFCFEPDPRNIKKFTSREFSKDTHLYGVAVGDKDGEVLLHQSTSDDDYTQNSGRGEHTDSSSIKDVSNTAKVLGLPWLKFKEPITVKIIRLDTWLKSVDIDHIDLLWSDVEGAEEEMIKGGLETLSITHYFYTEYSDKQKYGKEITMAEILNLLPDFELLYTWSESNALLHNTEWGCKR